jgi:hypothetical protein
MAIRKCEFWELHKHEIRSCKKSNQTKRQNGNECVVIAKPVFNFIFLLQNTKFDSHVTVHHDNFVQ